MKSNYKILGKFIRPVNIRNVELKATTLLGVNIGKFFMPSVANIIGTDMTAYKIIKKRQFACNRMHVGRDYRLPVAISTASEDFLVSPAYDVFEVTNTEELLPEYLMMWLSRKEFDRNAWFYTDADVRGGLNWKAFCEMELPVPNIDKQKEIVKEYNVLVDRIELNNKIIKKLEETAQAIYRQWFIDFEFPNKDGKPYKSSGGEMEFNEELEKDVPKGWRVVNFDDISLIQNGYAFRSSDYVTSGCKMIRTTDIDDRGFINDTNSIFLPIEFYKLDVYSNFKFEEFDFVIVMVGASVGKIGLITKSNLPSLQNQNMWRLRPKKDSFPRSFIIENAKIINDNVKSQASGSARDFYTKDLFKKYRIILPDDNILAAYKLISESTLSNIGNTFTENRLLSNLVNILLSKIATINN